MTLAQHFLIVSIFPLTFLGLLVFVCFNQSQHRVARRWWLATLLAATLWSSVILRFHVDQAFTAELIYGWGVAANYGLSLTALGLLLATGAYLGFDRSRRITAVAITAVLIVAAFMLDIHLWGYYLGPLLIVGQVVDQFDLWIAMWIASWWLAAFSALLVTLQQRQVAPADSIYRNRINYWLIVIILFLLGSSVASVQQHNRPIYQEIGVLFILPAMILGTISIIRSQIPDLQLTVRRLLNRLSGTLIVFGITWLVLSLLAEGLANLPPGLSHNLVLMLAAALFTGLFMLVYRVVDQLTRRVFLPTSQRHDLGLADYTRGIGNLPEPDQLGRLMLHRIALHLGTTDSHCYLVEEGPGGRLMTRPLVNTNGSAMPPPASFAADSPFVTYLRQSRMPLVYYDLTNLPQFADLPETERATLQLWDKMLYLPLKAGDNLIGIIALGVKESGEAYDLAELGWLVAVANQAGPLLAQACHLDSLRHINDFVFAQNQILAHRQQHSHALRSLQHQFVNLVSPELKRPLSDLEKQLNDLHSNENGQPDTAMSEVRTNVALLRSRLDGLIRTANHIQKQDVFDFKQVHLDAIIRSVMRKLNTMAEARRILIEYNMAKLVPDIEGDEARLHEAIHHLLHNAIKFNKIGGQVKIDCYVESGDLCVRINDSGVGIRPDRLPHIWFGPGRQETNGSQIQDSGLGLMLAQFIITAHGGHIDVETSYGQGSTFTVYLPLALVEDAPANRSDAAEP